MIPRHWWVYLKENVALLFPGSSIFTHSFKKTTCSYFYMEEYLVKSGEYLKTNDKVCAYRFPNSPRLRHIKAENDMVLLQALLDPGIHSANEGVYIGMTLGDPTSTPNVEEFRKWYRAIKSLIEEPYLAPINTLENELGQIRALEKELLTSEDIGRIATIESTIAQYMNITILEAFTRPHLLKNVNPAMIKYFEQSLAICATSFAFSA